MRKTLAALAVAGALAADARSAHADGEAWLQFEYRLPVLRTPRPAWPRTDVRVYTENRLNGRSEGLHLTFLRVGPIVYPTPWLFVATHGTVIADHLSSGVFEMEVRAELEPNVFFRLGPFTFNDRNRVEYRWRASAQRWRYRNQLRINYAPQGAWIIPFVWDEVLVDLSGAGFNQNRASAGMSLMLWPNVRLDVSYLFRSRLERDGWQHDHGVIIAIFVDVPVVPPAPPAMTPPVPPPGITPGAERSHASLPSGP